MIFATPSRRRALCAGILALGTMVLAGPLPASAETLSISAVGLVWRGPDQFNDNTDSAQENKGVFIGEKPNGRYFAPVIFPVTSGQKICNFAMVYHDINASDTITARLFRKSFTVGSGAFNTPTTLATVKSASGVSDVVRTASTAVSGSPAISVSSGFYYIEVDVPTFNLNLLGFQIVYKTACP